jgi:hypothetical protein
MPIPPRLPPLGGPSNPPFRSYITPRGGSRGWGGRKATLRAIFGGDLGSSTVRACPRLVALSTRSALRSSNSGFLARQIRAPQSTFFEPPHRSEPGHPHTPLEWVAASLDEMGLTMAISCHHPSSRLDSFPAAQLDSHAPIPGIRLPGAICPRIPVRRESTPPGRPRLRGNGRGAARWARVSRIQQ